MRHSTTKSLTAQGKRDCTERSAATVKGIADTTAVSIGSELREILPEDRARGLRSSGFGGTG